VIGTAPDKLAGPIPIHTRWAVSAVLKSAGPAA